MIFDTCAPPPLLPDLASDFEYWDSIAASFGDPDHPDFQKTHTEMGARIDAIAINAEIVKRSIALDKKLAKAADTFGKPKKKKTGKLSDSAVGLDVSKEPEPIKLSQEQLLDLGGEVVVRVIQPATSEEKKLNKASAHQSAINFSNWLIEQPHLRQQAEDILEDDLCGRSWVRSKYCGRSEVFASLLKSILPAIAHVISCEAERDYPYGVPVPHYLTRDSIEGYDRPSPLDVRFPNKNGETLNTTSCSFRFYTGIGFLNRVLNPIKGTRCSTYTPGVSPFIDFLATQFTAFSTGVSHVPVSVAIESAIKDQFQPAKSFAQRFPNVEGNSIGLRHSILLLDYAGLIELAPDITENQYNSWRNVRNNIDWLNSVTGVDGDIVYIRPVYKNGSVTGGRKYTPLQNVPRTIQVLLFGGTQQVNVDLVGAFNRVLVNNCDEGALRDVFLSMPLLKEKTKDDFIGKRLVKFASNGAHYGMKVSADFQKLIYPQHPDILHRSNATCTNGRISSLRSYILDDLYFQVEKMMGYPHADINNPTLETGFAKTFIELQADWEGITEYNGSGEIPEDAAHIIFDTEEAKQEYIRAQADGGYIGHYRKDVLAEIKKSFVEHIPALVEYSAAVHTFFKDRSGLGDDYRAYSDSAKKARQAFFECHEQALVNKYQDVCLCNFHDGFVLKALDYNRLAKELRLDGFEIKPYNGETLSDFSRHYDRTNHPPIKLKMLTAAPIN